MMEDQAQGRSRMRIRIDQEKGARTLISLARHSGAAREVRQERAVSLDRFPEALTVPVKRLGASTTDQALSMLLAAADGYPFFLQTYGRAAWDAAPGRV